MLGNYTISRCRNSEGIFNVLANDKFIGDALRQGQLWEPHINNIIKRMISEDKVAVNIGSHIGSHAIPLTRGSKKTYIFEPQPMIYWLMTHNLFDNNLHNKAETFNVAVGHVNGINVTMTNTEPWSQGNVSYNTNQSTNYGAIKIGNGDISVPMMRLDDLNIEDPISVILVDVEGAEPMVFWGARETIKRHRPILIFERNNWVITEDMKRICNIPEEVVNFKVEDYVAGMDYSPMFIYGEECILIPKPEKTMEVAENYSNGFSYQNGKFSHPHRKDIRSVWINENTMIVVFSDFNIVFTCQVLTNKTIIWSNGDLWIPTN